MGNLQYKYFQKYNNLDYWIRLWVKITRFFKKTTRNWGVTLIIELN